MIFTIILTLAGITYWVLSVHNWNRRCAAARQQFLADHR